MRAATTQGLVTMDTAGQIVPALAERWIVTDDGTSYIFRLRERNWPDGEPLTGEQVRRQLEALRRELAGTSLGADLAIIDDIRAMTGRVVEIRLTRPMPQFLRLLAQPELGIRMGGISLGPMARLTRQTGVGREVSADTGTDQLTLYPIPPTERGFARQPDWEELVRPVEAHFLTPEAAVQAFTSGELEVVLGGTLPTLPLVNAGPLSRGNVRLDAAVGLFGLDVMEASGFLAAAENRESLNMAIDRETLLAPFNIAGWSPRLSAVPTFADTAPAADQDPAWYSLPLEERIVIASARVAAWESSTGEEASVRIALPDGPGSDLLFREIARDWAEIGVTSVRVAAGENADLELRDRVARYDSERWYLNQFNCAYTQAICSEEADILVNQSIRATDPQVVRLLLDEAEALLTEQNGFISLGTPIRWSLVRGNIAGFQENQWAAHPLFPLSGAPI
ncbi:peptide ABC transporter substrate-binding protein [Altererythrobacter sp. HHU K3-1]|uniref:Peptide ABC transporter substrate-binding protein n=1 Tax=Qipengyuania atrilutea TaxID=2744473 RepID=A0A850H264_9SPHN|nr:peptide ABC transporter substrate-binding protein [Actirhodobacter atriluteus]